jgi:hypothetical protein
MLQTTFRSPRPAVAATKQELNTKVFTFIYDPLHPAWAHSGVASQLGRSAARARASIGLRKTRITPRSQQASTPGSVSIIHSEVAYLGQLLRCLTYADTVEKQVRIFVSPLTGQVHAAAF